MIGKVSILCGRYHCFHKKQYWVRTRYGEKYGDSWFTLRASPKLLYYLTTNFAFKLSHVIQGFVRDFVAKAMPKYKPNDYRKEKD